MIASNRGQESRGSQVDASAPEGRPGRERYDWDRLEHAVHVLVEQQDWLRKRCDSLRDEVVERDARIERLESRLLEANQLRQDTAKRIDELIAQLDQLDAHLAGLEPAE